MSAQHIEIAIDVIIYFGPDDTKSAQQMSDVKLLFHVLYICVIYTYDTSSGIIAMWFIYQGRL